MRMVADCDLLEAIVPSYFQNLMEEDNSNLAMEEDNFDHLEQEEGNFDLPEVVVDIKDL